MEFAAGEHGFEHIARIHGPFGFARADNSMNFVDKKNDGPFGFYDFVENGFEAFLKFPAELGSGYEGGEIEGDNPFFF